MWNRLIPRHLCHLRSFSKWSDTGKACHLVNRSVLSVTGNQASNFLQGLITNDIHHLEQDGNDSMYCMFLNTAGRVLYDTIVYRDVKNPDNYFIECDALCSEALLKHMSMYRIRRKIDLKKLDDVAVWVGSQPDFPVEKEQLMAASRDPRVSALGWRYLVPWSQDLSKLVIVASDKYLIHRYQLGIAEGVAELPPSKLFPLESNCDYLHGVSFHKGCYLGQELTARTYHTGVTRKRIMPLVFQHKLPANQVPKAESPVRTKAGASAGKVRGIASDLQHGIATLRIEEALFAKALEVEGHMAKTLRPSWWPIEAPKDRATMEGHKPVD